MGVKRGKPAPPQEKIPKRLHVPIAKDDLKKVRRWQVELAASEAHVTKRLLHFAIRNGPAALGGVTE